MSYPNVIFGDYGDEKVAQSTAIGSLPLGQLMILPDGRLFRHAQCGSAAALSAGQIASCSAETAGHGNVSGSGLQASSVAHEGVAVSAQNLSGQNIVILRTKSAAVVKDEYASGYLHVLGPGVSADPGHIYKIKSNASAAVSTQCKFTLEPSDSLKAAFKSVSTLCSLRKSPYKDAILFNTGTVIAPPMGVTPVAVSASFYFWVQRSGIASVRQAATVLVDGSPVHASSAAAGSATLHAVTASTARIWATDTLGYALGAGADTEAVLVELTLE